MAFVSCHEIDEVLYQQIDHDGYDDGAVGETLSFGVVLERCVRGHVRRG